MALKFVDNQSELRILTRRLTFPDGPGEVLIVKPNKEPVGQEMFTMDGSTTELQCLTDCFPVCSTTWFYRGGLLSRNASISFTPVTPPYETALTCVAFNSVTKRNRTAATTVVVPGETKSETILFKWLMTHISTCFGSVGQTDLWFVFVFLLLQTDRRL